VLATAALSGLFVVASIALQAPSWATEFDHSLQQLRLLRQVERPT